MTCTATCAHERASSPRFCTRNSTCQQLGLEARRAVGATSHRKRCAGLRPATLYTNSGVAAARGAPLPLLRVVVSLSLLWLRLGSTKPPVPLVFIVTADRPRAPATLVVYVAIGDSNFRS